MPTTTTNYGLNKPLVNDPVDEDLWGGYLNDSMDDIDTQMKVNADAVTALITVPIGSILDYVGTSAPTNYLLCYGQAISRTTYSALFAIAGTTYGVGDGSTTFNLPDYRGRVGAGQDDMGGTSANRLTGLSGGVDGDVLGATGGAETHTLTTAQIPAHTHEYGVLSSLAGGGSNPAPDGVTPNTGFQTASTGGGGAHNNVQPTIIINKIIRAL